MHEVEDEYILPSDRIASTSRQHQLQQSPITVQQDDIDEFDWNAPIPSFSDTVRHGIEVLDRAAGDRYRHESDEDDPVDGFNEEDDAG